MHCASELGYIGVSEGAIILDFLRMIKSNTETYISSDDNWIGRKHCINHFPFIKFRRIVQRPGNSAAMDKFRGPQKTVGPGISLHNLSYTSQATKVNFLRYNGHFPCETRSAGTKDKFTAVYSTLIKKPYLLPNISNTIMFGEFDCLWSRSAGLLALAKLLLGDKDNDGVGDNWSSNF